MSTIDSATRARWEHKAEEDIETCESCMFDGWTEEAGECHGQKFG